MAKNTKRDFAVLENEYGDVNIDKEILANNSDNPSINIWESIEGCVCCSAKGTFAESIIVIANGLDPEFLVVEPTGVAKLGNIISNIKKVEYDRIKILSPVAIVDPNSIDKYINDYGELFINQLENAGKIFVSKSENLSTDEKQEIENKIKKIAPNADIITDHYATIDKGIWDELLNTMLDGSIIQTETDSEEMPDAFSLSDIKLPNPEKLIIFLDKLIHGYYGNIIRAKGIIPCGNLKLAFDVSDSKYTIFDAPGEDAKTVFFGRDIDRNLIRQEFFVKIPMRGRG